MFAPSIFCPFSPPGGGLQGYLRNRIINLAAVAHVDLTDTGALVIVPGYSLGPAGGSAYRVECRDSSGRATLGFAGPAGTGADPGLEAADTVTGITKANPGVTTFAAGHGLVTGNLVRFSGLAEMTELNGAYVNLRAQTGDDFNILNTSGYGAAETTGGQVAARVSNPGADGLTVYQDRDLTTQGWAWVDPAFNPNLITEIIIDRTPDLRLLQVGVDLGGPAPDIGAGSFSFSPGEIVKETITPVGLAAREMFKHTSASAGFPAWPLIGNFSQITGQALLLVVPGFTGYPSGNGGFVATWNGFGSLSYTNGTKIVATDGPGLSDREPPWGNLAPVWIITQWWDSANQPAGTNNAQGFRIGYAALSAGTWSITWATDAAYDGAFTDGSLIRLFYDNQDPFHWDHLLIHAQPQVDADLLSLITDLVPPE